MHDTVAIGIDLGTSRICAGGFDKNTIRIIDKFPGRQLPCFITFKPNSSEFIGQLAKEKIRNNSHCTISCPKILLGKCSNDLGDLGLFKIHEDKNKHIKIQLNESRPISPEEITAILLRKVKIASEEFYSKSVKDAVITVPACFDNSQRQATLDSAKLAGLNVLVLLNDSTAAAVAICHEKNFDRTENILIFDLGANFLNLSVVKLEYGFIEVKIAKSFADCAGKAIDCKIVDYVKSKLNVKDSTKTRLTLNGDCEKAKITLSNAPEAVFEVELASNEDTLFTLKRDDLNALVETQFSELVNKVNEMLECIKLDKSKIDEVVMIGGSSRIPFLQKKLSQFFNGKKLNFEMNASETVANGAAIQAAFLSGNKLKKHNGFKYKETCGFNFILSIELNGVPHSKIEIGSEFQTPASQSITLITKKAVEILITVYKNEENISELLFNKRYFQSENKKCEFKITLQIDKNRMFGIQLKLNGNKVEDLVVTNPKCLGPNEFQEIVKFSNDKLNKQNQSIKYMKFKNELEKQCYDLQKKFKNSLVVDVDTRIDSILMELNSVSFPSIFDPIIDEKLNCLSKKLKDFETEILQEIKSIEESNSNSKTKFLPESLGIGVKDGLTTSFFVEITENPIKREKKFSYAFNEQTSCNIMNSKQTRLLSEKDCILCALIICFICFNFFLLFFFIFKK